MSRYPNVEEHQLTVTYQSPRSNMNTLPTLPPISTLSYDNFGYKSPSSEQYRNSPSTPYSASSSTSSFTYLPSPLPQPSTPTQNPPSQPPLSQPSYYQHQQQQRSPQTTYYSQPAYSSYSQYPQQNSPGAQPSPRRTTQQLQQNYSSQQQPSPIYNSPDKRLTLREVYQWIMERYPQLYKADDTGWQVPRSDTELGHSTSSSAASKGKGGYWTIDPEYMSAYHDGVFARGGVQKRRPGEVGVGIHPGMGGPGLGDDDSGGSDTSPSDNNMAGRLVEVEDDSEKRIPLTLTVPSPVSVSSSTSLMTPPLSSSLTQKKFYVPKRHSSEPNFTNLTSPSPSNYASSVNVNASGSNSGRCDVFNITDTTDVSNPSSDHSNLHIDISPYPVESRSSGPGSEWNISSDSSIKREIKMEYYYNEHPAISDIHSTNSSVAGSMKIRNLLN
ncbi:19244_t:CDS:2 [Rhizophagus irregularis]|nr:19244_t:CDS:2 [Rhizophagus irregularis]